MNRVSGTHCPPLVGRFSHQSAETWSYRMPIDRLKPDDLHWGCSTLAAMQRQRLGVDIEDLDPALLVLADIDPALAIGTEGHVGGRRAIGL